MGIRIGIGGIRIGSKGGGAAAIDGNPSALVLTVLSDTSIKLDWTIGSTNQDGHYIYISFNDEDYSLVANVVGETATYTINDLIDTTLYYIKVCAYLGSEKSLYTDVENCTTNYSSDEKIINGQFTTTYSPWTKGNEWVYSNNKMTYSYVYAGAGRNIFQSNTIIADAKYRLRFTISNCIAGSKIGFVGTTDWLLKAPYNDYFDIVDGDYDILVEAAISDTLLQIFGGLGGGFSLDNISLKKIELISFPETKILQDGYYESSCLGDVIYACNKNNNKVSRSIDQGDNFTDFNKVFDKTLMAIFVSKDGILLASCGELDSVDGEIWRSADDGENWTKVCDLIGGNAFTWSFAQASDGVIFIGTYSNLAASDPYLWKSVNDGVSWNRIDYFKDIIGVDKHLHKIHVDNITNRLYVSTGDSVRNTYYSDDDGANWTELFSSVDAGFTGISSNSAGRYFADDLQTLGKIYKSTNDITLVELFTATKICFEGLYYEVFVVEGGNVIYATSYNEGVSNGKRSFIIKSNDGGSTWQYVATSRSEDKAYQFHRASINYKGQIPSGLGYFICHCEELKRLIRITI